MGGEGVGRNWTGLTGEGGVSVALDLAAPGAPKKWLVGRHVVGWEHLRDMEGREPVQLIVCQQVGYSYQRELRRKSLDVDGDRGLRSRERK